MADRWEQIEVWCDNPDCNDEIIVSICVNHLEGKRVEVEVADIPDICPHCRWELSEMQIATQASTNYDLYYEGDR